MKRILFTNNTLGTHAGSEMYVRDVAFALLQAGWQPMAFSTELGAVAEDLREMTIPVVSDLARLPYRPDVIHAHHHLDAMAAIQQFPGVPVIYFCHGWQPWEETPVRHPQIFRYVAVDELCRERLVIEHAIPESQVEVLLNFVDLRRFHPRPPLPEKPQRALVFGHFMEPGHPVYEAVCRACEARDIFLEIAGVGGGASSSRPELQLPQYDLVFGKARCALEAMAVGCAVIVCDTRGMGGMVTPETFDSMRPLNFGMRILRRNPAPTPQDVEAQIALYDAEKSQQVTQRIRAEADQSLVVRRLMALYEEAAASAITDPSARPGAEAQAIADYLVFLSRDTKEARRALPTLRESQELNQSQAAQLAALQSQFTALEATHTALAAEHAALQIENANLKSQCVSQGKQLEETRRWAEELQTKLQRFKGLRRFLPRWLAQERQTRATIF
jgi:glycosyltransferase involved in cell wall biosynthesis